MLLVSFNYDSLFFFFCSILYLIVFFWFFEHFTLHFHNPFQYIFLELPLCRPELFPHGSRSGLLLFGPPGGGKTLVAKALANECGLPFLSVRGPELLGSYVGESEANVREIFASARDAATASSSLSFEGTDNSGATASVLFFDEIDSLAPCRGGANDGGGVMDRVVATLLGELDHATSSSGRSESRVIVVAATNRPDLLDPALLRPGRLDRVIYLGPAQDRDDRIAILSAQTRKFTFENGMDSKTIAAEVINKIPTSLSGADFSAVASGAFMRSVKRLCDKVDAEALASNENTETVMGKWNDHRLVPIVTKSDLILAAKDVTPSISKNEMKHYEAMIDQFSCVIKK